ncbi:mitochondrial large subunit ribosomal protein L45 [Rhodotorula toruloides]|uniref:Mitochondrial large subunit ribosomal protein L45 n=1 Tax=Rhodotorula toruloides TaxID=5286 RepID=A0A511KAK1_RHOTO|nr:mitochondrial large subunit ribosomal protein L45 [Rhodotorula toruloides]
MQAVRSFRPPLVAQLVRPSAAFAPAVAASFIASQQATVPAPRRGYATEPDSNRELQIKQARLMEKMNRRKQTVDLATTSAIPVFANYIPPRGRRVIPADSPYNWRSYVWHDVVQWTQSLRAALRWRKLLGKGWRREFNFRALEAYTATNQALASGKYELLRKYASGPVVEEVKAQRDRKLQGLALDWKLHRVVEQKILCMREQEIFKKDEFVGQVVVRFTTLQARSTLKSRRKSRTDQVRPWQSLEIRDFRGRLVGEGSHDLPKEISEVCILQRDMWRPEDDWKIIKRKAKETDTLVDPMAIP